MGFQCRDLPHSKITIQLPGHCRRRRRRRTMFTTPTLLIATVSALSSVVDAAVNVHLFPTPSRLSLEEFSPNAALSRHLGLEMFEEKGSMTVQEEEFIGVGGSEQALLVVMNEGQAADILPETLQKPSFVLNFPAMESLDSVISTYLHRARHAYANIHATFPKSLSLNDNAFATWNLESLPADELESAKRQLADLLSENPSLKVAVLTHTPAGKSKRASTVHSEAVDSSQSPFPAPRPPPQAPIQGLSTCHSSLDACTNSTNFCSGHGQCMKASKGSRACFVCSCGISQSGEGSEKSTTYWAGEQCERKDFSSEFVLLAGTTIVLLLVIGTSVALLSSVGGVELPSVLMGGAVGGKKD